MWPALISLHQHMSALNHLLVLSCIKSHKVQDILLLPVLDTQGLNTLIKIAKNSVQKDNMLRRIKREILNQRRLLQISQLIFLLRISALFILVYLTNGKNAAKTLSIKKRNRLLPFLLVLWQHIAHLLLQQNVKLLYLTYLTLIPFLCLVISGARRSRESQVKSLSSQEDVPLQLPLRVQ